ncbi:MAG: DNA polymerase III subunit beta [Planctomycetes bacterium]|nr:DNA polymerase III subunit beta [Planctomycetota bacterium]
MKTVLPRQEFQDALTAMATLTSGRTTKPILSCVKLVASKKRVELSATDGEAALHLGVACISTPKEGQAVIPADGLLSIVRELTDAEVSIETDGRHCTIRGEGSEFRIFVMDAADFPPVPEFDGEADLVVDGIELRRMISMTLYAAARETSRYAINGVLWEKQGKRLYLVATDGRRLARAGGEIRATGSNDFEAIVPARALGVFEKVFTPVRGEDDWHVDVKILPNQVLLRSGDRVLSTVLVEGHFPKYQDVIPKNNDKRASMRRDELLAAVRRAATVTTEESRAIKLAFSTKELVITSQSAEQGDARVQLPIQYEGTTVEIGFNPHFIADCLRAVPFDTVFVELQESFRPGIICGEDKNDFLYVVMPVSLSN